MSETVNIKLTPADGWLEIGQKGFITASKSIQYCVADVRPTDPEFIGHHAVTFGNFDFTSDSSMLFVKGEATVILTTGSAFNSGGEPAPEGLYSGLRAVTVQSYVEANAKLGVQHEISVFISGISGNATNDTLFITGSLPVILKERTASYTGAGVLLEIFEDATYSDIGVPVPSYNLSRIVNTSPEAVFYSGATITTEGVTAFPPEYLIGNESNQGKGGTNHITGRERILKPNTTYMFRVTSLDGTSQDVWLFDSFYEGETDLPL